MRAIKALELQGTPRFFSQLIKVRFFIAATIVVSAFYATQSQFRVCVCRYLGATVSWKVSIHSRAWIKTSTRRTD